MFANRLFTSLRTAFTAAATTTTPSALLFPNVRTMAAPAAKVAIKNSSRDTSLVYASVMMPKASGMPTTYTPKVQKTNLLRTLALEEIAQRAESRPIPEFYSGSILKVTYRDSLSEKYPMELVGICIARRSRGLGSSFVIRNVIQDIGFNKYFFDYDPLITKIEVLRFARRRRAKLYYLRDRPPAESTFDQKMVAEAMPEKPHVDKPVRRVRGPRPNFVRFVKTKPNKNMD